MASGDFHLPFGEMTITLDDVSYLLHILVLGSFYSPLVYLDKEVTIAVVVEILGVSQRVLLERGPKTSGMLMWPSIGLGGYAYIKKAKIH